MSKRLQHSETRFIVSIVFVPLIFIKINVSNRGLNLNEFNLCVYILPRSCIPTFCECS